MRQRPLNPLDITLRFGRRAQRLRRAALALSVALTLGLPIWHLSTNQNAGAGLGQSTRFGAMMDGTNLPRAPLVGAPTSLRVFFIELTDPLEALAVLGARGPSWHWFLAVLPGLLLVALLGRFFCGWVCPYLPLLAMTLSIRWVFARLGKPLPDLQIDRSVGKWLAVSLTVASVISGAMLVPMVYPPALIGREVFRVVFYGAVSAGVLSLVAIVLFDTFVSRAGFCRSVCPGGATFSVIGSLSPLRITRDVAKCTDCTVCDVVCNLGQKPMTDKVDGGCERCGKCIASCPTKALSWSLSTPSALRRKESKP